MIELHFAVPMTGAVLNTINTRLDATLIASILDHGEAQLLFVDREYSDVVEAALALIKRDITLVATNVISRLISANAASTTSLYSRSTNNSCASP